MVISAICVHQCVTSSSSLNALIQEHHPTSTNMKRGTLTLYTYTVIAFFSPEWLFSFGHIDSSPLVFGYLLMFFPCIVALWIKTTLIFINQSRPKSPKNAFQKPLAINPSSDYGQQTKGWWWLYWGLIHLVRKFPYPFEKGRVQVTNIHNSWQMSGKFFPS